MTDHKILSSIIVGFYRDVKHKNITVLIILRLHFDRKQLYLFVFHELVSFEYLFKKSFWLLNVALIPNFGDPSRLTYFVDKGQCMQSVNKQRKL